MTLCSQFFKIGASWGYTYIIFYEKFMPNMFTALKKL